MRAGKKTETETSKTRPCIVFVKNLKEGPATKSTATALSVAPTSKVLGRKATITSNIKSSSIKALLPKRSTVVSQAPKTARDKQRAIGGLTPDSSFTKIQGTVATVASRTRNSSVGGAATPIIATVSSKYTSPLSETTTSSNKKPMYMRLSKKINSSTAIIESSKLVTTSKLAKGPITQVVSTPKQKMFKQSKASSMEKLEKPAPPTIAASRSRRSIKPNPKYASEDMVTPRYVAALTSDSPSKRGKHKRFSTDEPMEDNDDELTDAAFNPQLHKSDEDDDLSELEEELRREKVQVKRGRGRPPKAVTAARNNANTSSRSGGHQPTNLQQLRRNMSANMQRNSILASMSPPPADSGSTKRILDDSSDGQAPRKKQAILSEGMKGSPGANSINSKSSITGPVRASAGIANSSVDKKKFFISGNRLRTEAALGGVTSSKPRMTTYTEASPLTNSTRFVRRSISAAKVKPSTPLSKTQENNVHSFTIVNIDDIMSQDEVLITRSTTSAKKTTSTPASNSRVSDKDANTMVKSPATTYPTLSSSNLGDAISKPGSASLNAKKRTLSKVNEKSGSNAKPQPRILNTEMGKSLQPMKLLMSMGKERCAMKSEGDTEEDEVDSLDEETIEMAERDETSIIQVKTYSSSRTRHRTSALKWTSMHSALSPNTSVGASNHQTVQDRKLTKLLSEEDGDVFKKPSSPSQQRSKENALNQIQEDTTIEEANNDTASHDDSRSPTKTTKQSAKYFPPETTTICEEDGRIVKKITCYETWHVINMPKENSIFSQREERNSLELPLIKLANIATRVKVPTLKWTSKVTLYKVSPSLMQRPGMIIYTGDLKTYNIPETDRHKYQPACVLFRRCVVDRSKNRMAYDRAIIFKTKNFYTNIDGKHVNLIGAPETITTIKDVEILIEIVDSLSLTSSLVETVIPK